MNDFSQLTVLIYDNGLGLPIAQRLARDFKRTIYFKPWMEGFSCLHKACIGEGIDRLERVMDFWPLIDKGEIDLCVFPDVENSGLQSHLESLGIPVWGSKNADSLELNRVKFMNLVSTLGLDEPEYEVCKGVGQLRDMLKGKENCYVKISHFRGNMETRHWRSWLLDENWIDSLAMRFGGYRELIKFLVFDSIETPLEIGADGFNIDGQWPSLMLHGIEEKDSAYLGAVTPFEKLPNQLTEIMGKISDTLKGYRYRNLWSMEVRVKDDKAFFLDPTCRMGLPSTGSQLELWENFGEIVWQGAHGNLVEPVPLGKFSAELIVRAKGEDGLWACAEIPKELEQWLKLADCCEIDGVRYWPREGSDDDCVGWLVAIGDTPQEAVDKIKGYAEALPEGLSVDLAPLADVLKNIATGEEEGIGFTNKPVPEPAEVIA